MSCSALSSNRTRRSVSLCLPLSLCLSASLPVCLTAAVSQGKQFAKKAKALAQEKAQNLLAESKVQEVESVYGADFWTKWA